MQASVGVVRCVWVGDHAVFHAILRRRTPRFLYDTLQLDEPTASKVQSDVYFGFLAGVFRTDDDEVRVEEIVQHTATCGPQYPSAHTNAMSI